MFVRSSRQCPSSVQWVSKRAHVVEWSVSGWGGLVVVVVGHLRCCRAAPHMTQIQQATGELLRRTGARGRQGVAPTVAPTIAGSHVMRAGKRSGQVPMHLSQWRRLMDTQVATAWGDHEHRERLGQLAESGVVAPAVAPIIAGPHIGERVREVLCLAPYLAPRRRLSHEALAAEIAHTLHALRWVGMRAEQSMIHGMRTSRATRWPRR